MGKKNQSSIRNLRKKKAEAIARKQRKNRLQKPGATTGQRDN